MICKIKTPAKINLFLHVIGRREDGYHLLESIFYFPDIYDEVSFSESKTTNLEITGRFAKELKGQNPENNLIITSYKILKDLFPDKIKNVSFKLKKNLPVASGIGGGSANAAGVLKGLNEYFKLDLSLEGLVYIAQKIGADVPAAIYSKPCFVSGIGEKIQLLNNFPNLNILLVNPLIAVSTAEIFKMGFRNYSNSIMLPDIKDYESLFSFLKNTKNNLQDNAVKLVLEIQEIINEIERQEGNLITRMSGSGATCFGIFDNKSNLQKAEKYFKEKYENYFVASCGVSSDFS